MFKSVFDAMIIKAVLQDQIKRISQAVEMAKKNVRKMPYYSYHLKTILNVPENCNIIWFLFAKLLLMLLNLNWDIKIKLYIS